MDILVIVGMLWLVVLTVVVAVAVARRTRASPGGSVAEAVDAVVAVARDKLDAHLQAGSRQLDHQGNLIGQALGSMSGELARVSDLVASLRQERAEHHGQLVRGLEDAVRTTASLADTTQGLREALASPKARGQWGERMAEDVLRLAGFAEGISYHKQTATASGSIPDFTFPLPDERVVHMDVKFPIDNYLRCLSSSNDHEREQLTTAFVRDVRARVKELTGRSYVTDGVTVDYVLMFIPNEAVYGFVHEHDPDLLDFSLGQRVVLCSPTTLFAVLGIIRQATETFAIARRSDEILDCLAGFETQWDKFSDTLDGVGKKLDLAHRSFEDLAGTRRRQLQRAVDRVGDLRSRRGLDEPVVSEVDGGGRVHTLAARRTG